MDQQNGKIPLKQAQLSVERFNEVALPHHLGLLKNHKSNIEKYLALEDWSKIRKEEINASRVIKQLKNLLYEVDNVRNKVKTEDLEKFDKLVEKGKQKAITGINEFLELQLKTPSENSDNVHNCASPTATEQELSESFPQLQLDLQNEEKLLQMRQSCLEEFEKLHHEVEDLHSMFHSFKNLVDEQAENVDIITDNVEEALENVVEGEVQLRTALKYKKAMYPFVGALVGTCIGGPIGLIAGIKAGGLAAIGCGILGFTGGNVLKSTEIINGTEIQHHNETEKKNT